jgi:uncharacterized membrane protein
MDWQAFFSLLLASGAEWVEGFAIILSATLTIGRGASFGAAAAAVVTLVLIIMAAGGVVSLRLHLWILQLATGVSLLRFGVRRLSRAVARQGGMKDPPNLQKIRPDLFGAERLEWWLTVFKAVLLEGLEVSLVVIGFSLQSRAWLSNVLAALAALAVVCLAAGRNPALLGRVPELAGKFVLGAMILSFGTLWTLQSLAGNVWPLGNWSFFGLVACYLCGGQVLVRLTGHRRPSGAET